ncbi:hypothetical protein FQR65_LT20531 [Abscondita terminalis]|nr:hypothetical protein FQR65_LT20531 [Abscondita terminalis]
MNCMAASMDPAPNKVAPPAAPRIFQPMCAFRASIFLHDFRSPPMPPTDQGPPRPMEAGTLLTARRPRPEKVAPPPFPWRATHIFGEGGVSVAYGSEAVGMHNHDSPLEIWSVFRNACADSMNGSVAAPPAATRTVFPSRRHNQGQARPGCKMRGQPLRRRVRHPLVASSSNVAGFGIDGEAAADRSAVRACHIGVPQLQGEGDFADVQVAVLEDVGGVCRPCNMRAEALSSSVLGLLAHEMASCVGGGGNARRAAWAATSGRSPMEQHREHEGQQVGGLVGPGSSWPRQSQASVAAIRPLLKYRPSMPALRSAAQDVQRLLGAGPVAPAGPNDRPGRSRPARTPSIPSDTGRGHASASSSRAAHRKARPNLGQSRTGYAGKQQQREVAAGQQSASSCESARARWWDQRWPPSVGEGRGAAVVRAQEQQRAGQAASSNNGRASAEHGVGSKLFHTSRDRRAGEMAREQAGRITRGHVANRKRQRQAVRRQAKRREQGQKTQRAAAPGEQETEHDGPRRAAPPSRPVLSVAALPAGRAAVKSDNSKQHFDRRDQWPRRSPWPRPARRQQPLEENDGPVKARMTRSAARLRRALACPAQRHAQFVGRRRADGCRARAASAALERLAGGIGEARRGRMVGKVANQPVEGASTPGGSLPSARIPGIAARSPQPGRAKGMDGVGSRRRPGRSSAPAGARRSGPADRASVGRREAGRRETKVEAQAGDGGHQQSAARRLSVTSARRNAFGIALRGQDHGSLHDASRIAQRAPPASNAAGATQHNVRWRAASNALGQHVGRGRAQGAQQLRCAWKARFSAASSRRPQWMAAPSRPKYWPSGLPRRSPVLRCVRRSAGRATSRRSAGHVGDLPIQRRQAEHADERLSQQQHGQNAQRQWATPAARAVLRHKAGAANVRARLPSRMAGPGGRTWAGGGCRGLLGQWFSVYQYRPVPSVENLSDGLTRPGSLRGRARQREPPWLWR